MARPMESAFEAHRRELVERGSRPASRPRTAAAPSPKGPSESLAVSERRRTSSLGVRGLMNWDHVAAPKPPGQRLDRRYDWQALGVDPTSKRFGCTVPRDDVSAGSLLRPSEPLTATIIPTATERRRARGSSLGPPRPNATIAMQSPRMETKTAGRPSHRGTEGSSVASLLISLDGAVERTGSRLRKGRHGLRLKAGIGPYL
eukprot:TRINITY_DN5174_c0_g1_i1.p1 TRINITY_DN5174_c0_g1~~TRINITY_DN5174_c0_g1_i1.p1  ORF type:complete len:202 (+),score=15.38 TRINITY_DN5174_c0_g1_i1:296-901(+)